MVIEPAAGEMYSKTDQLLGFDLTYGANPAIPYVFTYSANNSVKKVSAAGKNTSFKYDEGGQQLTGPSNVNSGSGYHYHYNARATPAKSIYIFRKSLKESKEIT